MNVPGVPGPGFEGWAGVDQRGIREFGGGKDAFQLFTEIIDWGSCVRECPKESSVSSLDRLRVLVMIWSLAQSSNKGSEVAQWGESGLLATFNHQFCYSGHRLLWGEVCITTFLSGWQEEKVWCVLGGWGRSSHGIFLPSGDVSGLWCQLGIPKPFVCPSFNLCDNIDPFLFLKTKTI